jgi:glyoxylase-like metal-dependent hydrolase (beta-lactamase superfamily II)
MKKKILSLIFAINFIIFFAQGQSKLDPALQKAITAMGTENVNTIEYEGTGKAGTLGQSHIPGMPWPMLIIKSYSRTIDYSNMSSFEEAVRVYDNPPAKGGGAPFLNEQKQTNRLQGFPSTLDTIEERHLQLLVTPHGFLKQASSANSSVKKLSNGTELSFPAGKYKVVGTINEHGLLEKVQTWTANPVLGDMLIETIYSEYKDYNSVKFPIRIVQNVGGHKVLDLTVSNVQPNISFTMPPAQPAAAQQPMSVTATKLADHIWFLSGGSHNSVLAEFSDHVVVLEAPLNEARSLAVIAEVKKLVQGKPIRYIVNSHHHFDHSGGLRTYVAEGASVITHAVNTKFFQDAWKAPRTIAPDKLSKNPKQATFIPVNDKHKLADGMNSLELYHNQGSSHNGGMLIGYFPKDKILFVVDEYSQGRLVDGKLVPVALGFAQNLYANLQRLKLDVSTIAPGHGTPVPFSELLRDIGK